MAALDLIAIALILVAGLAALLTAYLAVQVLAAAWPPSRAIGPAQTANDTVAPAFAVLIPAHDEASGIAATLQGLAGEVRPGDRILVVADNCSDATAQIARSLGADVVERFDATRRGKGYALDFGMRHLSQAPPTTVVIVDADCRVDPGTLQTIVALSHQTGRPVQARYDFEPPPGASGMAMATFASRLKNYVRPFGLWRLGLPTQLLGTGMAFPWATLAQAELASGEIVEDLVLGQQLAGNGKPPLYCANARVVSYFPGSEEGQGTQRARWETGHLRTIVNRLPSLGWAALRQRNAMSLALVADAAVPPLAFLAMSIVAIGLASLALALMGGSLWPLILTVVATGLLGFSVILAWWLVGRDVISLSELLRAPGYAVKKAALYGSFLLGRNLPWIRSKRD